MRLLRRNPAVATNLSVIVVKMLSRYKKLSRQKTLHMVKNIVYEHKDKNELYDKINIVVAELYNLFV